MSSLDSILKTHVSTPEHLFGLLSKYRVIVPGIQRHYVQGGAGDHAKEVRERFIGDILNSAAEGKFISLDYIYGPIDTSGIDAFTPVDGQQRLTTIWLTARYFAEGLSGSTRESVLSLLAKFSYEDRIHATRFCHELTKPKNLLGVDISSAQTVSQAITKQAWFNPFWSKDSTVSAMLNTLDTIAKLAQSLQLEPEKVLLHVGTGLNFKLCVDSFGQDIYMKMNARGLTLTQWENFKGKFARLLEGEDKTNWESLIETYSNRFFTASEKSLPDNPFLSLIARILLYAVSASEKEHGGTAIGRLAKHSSWNTELPYVPFSEFEQLVVKLKETSLLEKCVTGYLGLLGYILEKCSDVACTLNAPYWQEDRKLLNVVFLPTNDNERDFSLMLYEYFKKYEEVKLDEFKRAIRFMWNILGNVSYNEKKPYERIRNVAALCKSKDVYSQLADARSDIATTADQYREEFAKAVLYCSNNHEDIILLNETESLMHGRVRLALLDLNNSSAEVLIDKQRERLTNLKRLLDAYKDSNEEGRKLLVLLVVASEPIDLRDAFKVGFDDDRLFSLLTTRDDYFLQCALIDKLNGIDLENLDGYSTIDNHLNNNAGNLSADSYTDALWKRDWRRSILELAQGVAQGRHNSYWLWGRLVKWHNQGGLYLYKGASLLNALPINDWRIDLINCEKFKVLNNGTTDVSINLAPTHLIKWKLNTDHERWILFWKDCVTIDNRKGSYIRIQYDTNAITMLEKHLADIQVG